MNRGRYKKSNRRRRKIRNIVIISVVSAIALFIIFLAVGLSLSEKTKNDRIHDKNATKEEETNDKDTRKVKDVSAYPLPLLEDGSLFSTRLSKIKEGASAVCVSLNRPDGTLLYRSEIASKFTYLTVASDASKLSSSISSIEDDGLYTTATLHIPTFKETDSDLEADVELSIWGSVACEAIRNGVGDVLLIPTGATADDIDKLCALADRIHITEEKAVIGLCLPSEIFEEEKSVTLIDKLSQAFDYLAFDATNAKGEGTLAENIATEIKEVQHQLLYHKMRVLLPHTASTEELDALAETVTTLAISSWQALPH